MKVLNKTDLARESAKITGVSLKQSKQHIDALLSVIAGNLKSGNECKLLGYLTLKVKSRNAKNGRNPSTGKAITIPACKVVSAKVGSVLKKVVK